MKTRQTMILFSIILPLMTILSFYIYFEYLKTKEHIFTIIQEHFISEKIVAFDNYITHIKSEYPATFSQKIFTDKRLLHKMEKELRLVKGKNVQYLYLLYRDNKKHFRYMIDTTIDTDDKAEQKQRFNAMSDIWERAYQSKENQFTHQSKLDSLWITLACPVVIDNKVIAILGADFTYTMYDELLKTLAPMEQIFTYISFFIIIMFILVYLLIYIYYKMHKKAIIDPLTQVYNRQYLSEFLESKSLKDYYIMMLDIDHFKLVNDNYGHDIGDKVLKGVITKASSILRSKDTIIRFGGEEFLLFIHKDMKVDALTIANRIRSSIENLKIYALDSCISVTVSIGVNPSPYSNKDIEESIKIADEQLYIAKASGRNRVVLYEENKKSIPHSHNRITDVQKALDEGRIKPVYQAIYNTKSTLIEKYEMLVRLIDTDGVVLSPDVFLPSIRHTQVYITMTRFMIQEAISTLQKHDTQLSINLDLQDIINQDILKLFQNFFLNKPDIAKKITIEILEHEEIKDFELIQKHILLFKNLGFKIALDDFGSGYANFRYLIELDIDILKIDGSIIENIDEKKSAYNITKSIISLAKDMNIEVIAEQVEREEEYLTLKELEVDFIQGYYLAYPDFKLKES